MFCHDLDKAHPLPHYLPAQIDKHWVIEKNGNRIRILCNGVLVLDQTVSPRTCDESTYFDQSMVSKVWGQKVTSIRFSVYDLYDNATKYYHDTATKYYYIDSG